jgi:hypothetical protein
VGQKTRQYVFMRRYFFHFRSKDSFERDEIGCVLESSARALDHALELAMARITDPDRLCDWGKSAFEIEAEDGGEVLILSMASVLAERGAQSGTGHRWNG